MSLQSRLLVVVQGALTVLARVRGGCARTSLTTPATNLETSFAEIGVLTGWRKVTRKKVAQMTTDGVDGCR